MIGRRAVWGTFSSLAIGGLAIASIADRARVEPIAPVASIAARSPFVVRAGVDTFALSGARSWSLSVDRLGGDHAQFQAQSSDAIARADRTEIDRGHGVVEWLRVDGANVEQGFDVARAIDDSGRLRIALSAPSLVARVSASSVALRDARGRDVATIAGLVTRDARGRVLPSSFGASLDRDGEGAFEIAVDVRDAAYPIVVDPTISAPVAIPAYPGGVGTYYFGASIAIAGDLLIEGAPASPAFGTDHALDPGSAAAFVLESGTWMPLTTLMPATFTDHEQLGLCVATDGVTVAIGAPSAQPTSLDAGNNRFGFVYVFTRPTSGAWAAPTTLQLVDGVDNDQFGNQVAVEGDTIIVNALGRAGPLGQAQMGAFFDFERSGGAWSLVQTIYGPDDGAGSLASGLALAGNRLVIGSEYTGPGGEIAIFERTAPGATWSLQTTLHDVTPGVGELGAAVALAGDYAFAGAWGSHVPGSYDDAGVDAGPCDAGHDADPDTGLCAFNPPPTSAEGVVDVFHRDATGTWSLTQRLNAASPQPGGGFGGAVAATGSVLVVGEPGRSEGTATQTGSATVFTLGSDGNWQLLSTLAPSTPATNDQFGFAVATDGLQVFVDELQGSSGSGVVQVYAIAGLPDAGVDAAVDAVADTIADTIADTVPDVAAEVTVDATSDTHDAPIDSTVDAVTDARADAVDLSDSTALATTGLHTCKADSDCSTNFCVDGVCCDSRCGAPCHSCVLAAAPGTCLAQPYGFDLHG
ncbi:MAG: hypothetical protein ACHREM_26485, partial [Polyangiales bacterium]